MLLGVVLTLVSSTAAAGEDTYEGPLGTAGFPDAASLCRAWVKAAASDLPQRARSFDDPRLARTPRCRVEPRPVPFTPTGPWRSLHVAHVDDGIVTSTRLVVGTDDGVWLSPFAWGWDDPFDPGCPGIIWDVEVDRVVVDRGNLVVVLAGERSIHVEPTADDDPGYRTQLVRTAWWVSQDGPALRFHVFVPEVDDPPSALGTKIQPHHDRRVPWERLPWRDVRRFTFDAQGAPTIER